MAKTITLTNYSFWNKDNIGNCLQYEVKINDQPTGKHVRCYFDHEDRRIGWAAKGKETLHQNWRNAAKEAIKG